MVSFIKQHGVEEVARIEKTRDDEFTIQKTQYLNDEKKKIRENFENELANQEVRLKIEKSKQKNAKNLDKMRKVNEIVEVLRGELRAEIRQ